MALEVPVKGPGGIVVEQGYRRLGGLAVDFVNNTVDVTAVDYRSAEARKKQPHDPVVQPHWKFDGKPNPPSQKPSFDPGGSGDMIILKVEGSPGMEEFLAQPISAVMTDATEATSIRDILAAIGYGLLATRKDNADAKAV